MEKREEFQVFGALQNTLSLSRGASDRRATDRFPIVRDVRYKILNTKTPVEFGLGKTVNISSTGVLFSSENPVAPGKRLELSISWPAQLDGQCGLNLVARGRVIRSKGKLVAIEIEKYEFKTAGSKGLPPLTRVL
jgi:hypothetical protein